MKAKLIAAVLSVVAGVTAALPAVAQESYDRPVAVGESTVERLRGDAEDARRREADLSAQVAEQERANAALRERLRQQGGDPAAPDRQLADVSAEAAVLRKKMDEQRLRRDVARDKLAAAQREAGGKVAQTDAARAAQKAMADAGAELEKVAGPMVERLGQEDAAYQELQALVDAAAQTGEALAGFENTDPRAQAEADAAFDRAMEQQRAYEEAAVAADPRGREAQKAFAVARDTFEQVRADADRQVAADPKVEAAKFALDLEQKLLDDHAAELSTVEKRLSAMRQADVPAGAPNADAAAALRDGESRLRDLSDKLEQARIARRDTEDRLAQATTPPPGPSIDDGGFAPQPPPVTIYEPAVVYEPVYSGYSYPSYGGYGYGGYYGYRPYYYDDYCPPHWRSSLSFGLFFGSGYYYGHRHHHHHHDYYHRDYYRVGRDRYYTYGSRYRDDSWRSRYDYWRGRSDDGDRFRDGRYASRRDDHDHFRGGDRYSSGNSRYDYRRFDSTEQRRDRDARASLDSARRATNGGGVGGDRDLYRDRTGVSTYNYPGSSLAAIRARAYEQEVRERQAARSSRDYDNDRNRTAGVPRLDDERTRAGNVLRNERDSAADARARDVADSAARRARASEASSAGRGGSSGEWRIRDNDNDSDRPRTSSAATPPRTSRDVETPRSSRDVSPPSGGSSSRARASGDDAPRSFRTSPATPDRGGSSASPSRGSSRSEAAPPPPPVRSSRDVAPPPSRSSSRGSASPAPAPSPSRGTIRSGGSSPPPPSRSSSGIGSSRSSAPAPSAGPSRSSGGGGSSVRSSGGGGGSVRSSGGGSGGSSRSSGGSSSGGGGGRRSR